MNISIIKNMLTLPETGKDTILRMAYHSAKDLNSRPMSSNHPMFGIFREAMGGLKEQVQQSVNFLSLLSETIPLPKHRYQWASDRTELT